MIVQLSPVVYTALCGLVQDALQQPSDATHLLKQAAKELGHATANDSSPSEDEQPITFPRAVAAG